jgi:tetratricopeptide (TPR) repeat protein
MPKPSAARKMLTRQEQRDLDLEITFMEGIVRRDSEYVEALQILGDAYTRRGRYEDGLKVDQQLAILCPDNALVHYNLACSFSLTCCFDEAADALEEAINLGYRDFKWISQDPDLKNLRKQPCYRKIRAKVRRLKLLQR